MTTRTARPVKPVAVQAVEAAAVEAAVTANKPSAHERLEMVLRAIDKVTVKDLAPADVKWGKAIALQGGGSVYINRSNADVRSSQKQVADWAKQSIGTARGPQGQYLRILFL